MHFLSQDLEDYIALNSEPESDLLQALSRETHLKVLRPRMITGHHQGRMLSLISQLVAPKNILEIGTYTGYSALCLAEGLVPGGKLQTIEMNAELASIQKKYFDQSAYASQIIPHLGAALDIIPKLPETFDLVFIDAEKREYPDYFEAVLPKVRPGGLILLDNVLWSGKVVEAPQAKDPVTPILRELNRKLAKDPRVQTVLLPIRDGLTACRVR